MTFASKQANQGKSSADLGKTASETTGDTAGEAPTTGDPALRVWLDQMHAAHPPEQASWDAILLDM